jgi:hypothetical protein
MSMIEPEPETIPVETEPVGPEPPETSPEHVAAEVPET